MLAYTAADLLSLCRVDLRPPNTCIRTVLFKLRLWLPRDVRLARVHSTAAVTSSSPLSTGPGHVTRGESKQNKSNSILSLATWNVCSLGNKSLSVSEFILSNKLDLFCLTESRHADPSDVAVLRSTPAGYRCIDVARPPTVVVNPPSRPSRPPKDATTRGGGVILYFREHFAAKKFDVVAGIKSFEYVCVSIPTLHGPVVIVTIYRPGSSLPNELFFREFSSLLEVLVTYNSQLVIAGDLNIHFEDPSNSDTIRVNQMLTSFALTQHVAEPTHNKGGYLDVIITRSDCSISDLRVDPPALSDHGQVFCSIPLAIPAAPIFTSRQVRGWKKLDHDAFRSALLAGPLCQDPAIYQGMSADQLFQLYDDTLRSTLDKFVPLHEVKSRSSNSSPWFDDECRATKRKVRLLERRYRRSRDDLDRLAWVSGLRDKHTFFKTKESQYWERVVTSHAASPKKLWNSVSSILGKKSNQPTVGPPFSASDFHSFLDQKVNDVRTSTAGATPPDYTPTMSRFDSFDTCSSEVVERIIRASPSKSCQLDPIPTFVVKQFLDTLLPFLTCMCNASVQEGLPASQMDAVITPVIKKVGLDPDELKSYRPISNLSFMSKVVEKLIFLQLSSYLAENNLLPKLQSGFRRFHSTESAVYRVLSDVYSAVDRGEVALLALLDVSAAFDTVDHAILLKRLSVSYGLSGPALSWFQTFITGRTQSVQLGSSSSSKSPVRFGIPQGSVLGPILYVLYTADVAKLVESSGLRVHLYADDTQLYGFCKAMDSTELSQHMFSVIEKVNLWMSSNRLRLNQDKTEFIWFGTRQQLAKRDLQSISTISPSLISTSVVRNLGALLDSELTMEKHAAKICQSCFFQLRRLRAIRETLTRSALLTLVHAFITTRIDYCNSILYGASKHVLDSLQYVMNAAARLILYIPKYDHISAAIRSELHWLPVPRRIDFKICLLVRNCLTGCAPSYLAEFCKLVSSEVGRRDLRSASRGDLVVPRFHLERSGRRSFSVAGPSLWNSLPLDVRDLKTGLEVFKRGLKTFLMQQL